ncbi:unnamed protein product [Ectocarpus sp. CCAP 1310/34]|nr:unnamed protein product [Ectocarpus sp. CCAP 1310/34]
MSAAEVGPAAAVSKPGKCERILWLGNQPRGEVLLITTLVDKKSPNRSSNKLLKNKRERWEKARGRSGGSSSSGGGAKTNADREVADPVMAAFRGCGRTRYGVTISEPAEPTAPADWRQQSTETFVASMDSMGYNKALHHLEGTGSKFAKETRVRVRELEAKVSTAVSLERALEQAQRQRRTKEGSHTFQTILTAASYPVDDVDGAPSVSARRRAAALGVREQAFNFAAERAKKLLSDLQPTEAIKRGVYWFWVRAKQSNAPSEELLELMRQYWHTDEMSRQHGNSAERDMWNESKSPTAHRHPRWQLTEPGGGEAVYAKFLNWASYKSFKERQSDNFTDPGCTLFLSTRCKCLVLPAMEQCACKIHSQQVLYIEALANVDITSHGECDCRWCNVDGERR